MPVTACVVSVASVNSVPLAGKLLKTKLSTVPSGSLPERTTGITVSSSRVTVTVSVSGTSLMVSITIVDVAGVGFVELPSFTKN